MANLNPREILISAKFCYEKADYKKALSLLNDLIEIDSKMTEAYYILGNIFHINGEVGKAIKAFTQVLDLDPNYTDASIALSVLFNDIGKYEDAKRIFDKANHHVKNSNHLIVDPHINRKFSFKHYELAEQYFTFNRFEDAIVEYNKACILDPENLEIRIKIAKTYAKKGFNSKAFDELKKIKNEYPGYLPARVALGILYFSNGNVIEAQTEWQSVLAKDPNNEEALMYLNLSNSASETQINV